MVHQWAALVATLTEGVEDTVPDTDSNLTRMDLIEEISDLEICLYTFSYTIDM